MDCLLCSSKDCDLERKNNSLRDYRMFNARKTSKSLCDLLGLPLTPFQENFLQSNISYCTPCTQFLDRITTLFNDLETLQARIAESKTQAENMILKSLQINHSQEPSRNVELPISADGLRLEISKALQLELRTESRKLEEVPHSHNVVLSKGFILEDFVKSEVIDEDSNPTFSPAPTPFHIETEYDPVVNDEYEQDNVNVSPTDSLHPRSNTTNFKKSENKSTTFLPVENFNRILKIELTRLDEDEFRKLGSGGKDQSIFARRPPQIQTRWDSLRASKGEDVDYCPPPEKKKRRQRTLGNEKSKITSEIPKHPPKRMRRPRREVTNRKPTFIPCTFEDCHENFRTESLLRCHLMQVHSAPVRSFKCDLCPRVFPTAGRLEIHRRIHTGELSFKCSHCEESFHSINLCRCHETSHSEGKKYPCPSCPMIFINSRYLVKHSLVHTDAKNFICELCSSAFKRKIELVNHQKCFHHKELNLTPNKCRYCGKCFQSQGYLRIHERGHEGDHPCRCPHCPFSCDRPSGLSLHLLVHTKEKAFVCEQCGKSFRRKVLLDTHLMDHTGERPLACELCDKRFKRKDKLKRHMALHIGLRTFKCDLCGEGFPVRKYLNRHLVKHKNGRIPPPAVSLDAPPMPPAPKEKLTDGLVSQSNLKE